MTDNNPEREVVPLSQAAIPPPPPYAQPTYDQAPWQQGEVRPPAWGAPTPSWQQLPRKKRKVWPWVVGGVGALVVLAGVATALILSVTEELTADQNENYDGAPVTVSDAPTIGSEVVISTSGRVAFEIGSDWVLADDYLDVAAIGADLPPQASIIAVYFSSDPAAATSVFPSLVVVVEGSPEGQVGSVSIDSTHAQFVESGTRSLESNGVVALTEEPRAATTAHGLEGLVTDVSVSFNGTDVRVQEFTFARFERVVFVEVLSYNGEFDTATAALITDSLRIEK